MAETASERAPSGPSFRPSGRAAERPAGCAASISRAAGAARPTRILPSEADVLAAMDPSDSAGTPTYVIRNRLPNSPSGRPRVADVRRVLDRLERQGRVHRTKFTRANQVHWKSGARR